MTKVLFDKAKVAALSSSITAAVPGLTSLDAAVAALRESAHHDMQGTLSPSDSYRPDALSNSALGLDLLDLATEMNRRIALLNSLFISVLTPEQQAELATALTVIDHAAVAKAVSAIRDFPDQDAGLNGNRDELLALGDQLSSLSGAELDAVLDELSDEELATLAARTRDSSSLLWVHHGLERMDRFEFWGNLLSNVSPSRIPRVLNAFPEFNPPFDSTDAFRDQNTQTGESADGAAYGVPDGPLWQTDSDGKPDIDPTQSGQGSFADCWFIASVLAAQQRNPEFVPSNMKLNPNGTISVRMFEGGGNPHWTAMTNELPMRGGRPVGGRGDSLWLAYYEKAFAQLYTDDTGGAPDDHPEWDEDETGTYGALEWDFSDKATPYLTGEKGESHGADFEAAIDEFRKGHPVLVASKADASQPPKAWGNSYSTRHQYYVVKVTDDSIVLANPWGADFEQITVTAEEFDDFFGEVTTMPSGD